MAAAAAALRGVYCRATSSVVRQSALLFPSRRPISTTNVQLDEAEEARVRGLFQTATIREDHVGPGAKVFSLQHADAPGIPFATIGLMQREGQRGMMHGTAVHSALPFVSAVKLVKHVLAEATDQPPIAAASLNGLCTWVSEIPTEELQNEFGDELAEAVVAIATGQPRPGHSVLGQGTFTAAEPAWMVLAGRFANEPEAEEVRLFHAAGFDKDIKLQPMADTSPDGIAKSGGTMALLRMPPN
eukprot:gene11323-10966_t